MTTIETTKSFDAVNSSEFVDASKDKKFGKETKEKIEKEDVKRLMKALKSVGEKQPKDGSVKMLKSVLGVTDKDPSDKAVEAARETIKKAHMTVEEVTKKIADKKTEQEKLEGVKNVLVEYVGKTGEVLGTLGTNKELKAKFGEALRGVSDFGKEQFFFFLKWARKIASPKKVVEKTTHIIEKGPLAPMDMTKEMVGITFGVAGYPMLEAMKKANIVPTEKEVNYGLMNPFKFLQDMYKKALEILKRGLGLIDPSRYVPVLNGYLHNYFPVPVSNLVPSLPHGEKEKEIREWFENAANRTMDWMSETWKKIQKDIESKPALFI